MSCSSWAWRDNLCALFVCNIGILYTDNMAEHVRIEIETIEHFERLMTDKPEMQKRARKIIASVMQKARSDTSKGARDCLENDPRAAYKAVKRMVYKRMLGGNISILNKRKAGNTRVMITNTNPHTGRGGNRRPVSARTEQITSYYGSDRGFVLRFVNSGTKSRMTRYGNRGSIAARNWFEGVSQYAVERAASAFEQLIEQEIKNTEA